MADKKITDLTELTAVASDDYFEVVDTSTPESKKISRENLAGWHFLTTPLTSTSWDGDSFSTTSKTLIDLSTAFGAPAGVKAVLIRLTARDSGSASTTCQLAVSPNDTADSAVVQAYLQGFDNNVYGALSGICPCDANGDIYYQIAASGTGTLQAWIQIWGYWL